MAGSRQRNLRTEDAIDETEEEEEEGGEGGDGLLTLLAEEHMMIDCEFYFYFFFLTGDDFVLFCFEGEFEFFLFSFFLLDLLG